MTDSIRILPPGFQVTNAAGTPQAGAVLRFYDAGTSNTRTVYSNSGLSTSLGVTVTTNSAGRPAASGGVGAETLIYTGTTAYKITAETSLAVALWSFDNVVGALDTSTFLPEVAIPSTIISTKAANYTILTTDRGTLFYANCTAGNLNFNLPSAVTAGNGFRVGIKHTGTLNQVLVGSVGGQTIDGGGIIQITLPSYGSVRWFVSDGANWAIDQFYNRVPLIADTNMAGAAVSIDLTPYNQYRRIRIVMSGIIPVTNLDSFLMRTSTDGGVTYDSGVADYAWVHVTNQMVIAGTEVLIGDDADSSISISDNNNSNANYQMNVEVSIANFTDARVGLIHWQGSQGKPVTGYLLNGSGTRLASTNIDAVKFFFSTGNILGGQYSVYGDL